ncbi:MAG: adenylate/guanylate cyclase domain-containing protein [Balneolaceae bacterium]
MSSKKRKDYISFIVIGLVGLVSAVLLTQFEPVATFEHTYTDQLFEWRGPLDVSESPVVLVAISEFADSEIPQKYPWPAHVHARLVENLNRAGASVILYDVIFQDADSYDFRNDTLFAEALKRHGNVILAGQLQRENTRYTSEENTSFPQQLLRDNNPNPVALVQVLPDVDGTVRTYNFGRNFRENSYYTLGIEAIRLYGNIPRSEVDPLDPNLTKKTFDVGKYEILRDRKNSFIINYTGPESHFPTYSFEEVIDDRTYQTESELIAFEMNTFDDPDIGLLQQGVFEDKIVIVGSTMPVLKDFFRTPFATQSSNPRPGYEIHANAIQTILEGNYLKRLGDWYTVAIIILFSFFVTGITRLLNTYLGLTFTILLGAGYVLVTYLAFIHFNLLMIITGPLLALFVSQVGLIGYEYYIEQKEKRRIKGMFSSYVSPELVNQMVESGEEPQLGGEEKYMTAFFSDIVSFSTFSEQLKANELVELINEYLSAMTEIINDRGGTLDKYIGDAIVAFYGAPVFLENHSLQACITSQLMHNKLAELREKWKKDGWPEIVINMQHRIGLNTGNMVTGNMGSERRFNYTMMGDNVNLAARCESGAKQYGVYTMVTESTKNEAEKFGNNCVFRLLDNIIVKGRTRPVKVFEIAGLRADANQQLFECIGLYEEGMELYFSQNWNKAIKKFRESLKLETHEKNPSAIFIERCRMMKENPPPEDWNGVYEMQAK